MADWTYGENLEDVPRDKIRWLLGDTTRTINSPTDGEIDYWAGVYTKEGAVDAYAAAAEIARSLGNRFNTLAASSVKIGGMTIQTNYAAQAQHYFDLAANLLEGQNQDGNLGGVLSNKSQPSSTFRIGMMDHG